MARKRKRQVSPGVTLGRDLRQPELCQTTYQQGGELKYGNFLDPHVGKKAVEADLPLRRFFQDTEAVAKWSQPVRPIAAQTNKSISGDVT